MKHKTKRKLVEIDHDIPGEVFVASVLRLKLPPLVKKFLAFRIPFQDRNKQLKDKIFHYSHSSGHLCLVKRTVTGLTQGNYVHNDCQHLLAPAACVLGISHATHSVLPVAQAETLEYTLIPFFPVDHMTLSATPVVSIFKICPESGCAQV